MKDSPKPPSFFLRLLRWFCDDDLLPHIEGDLMELYHVRHQQRGKRVADWSFRRDVTLLFRPGIIRSFQGFQSINNYAMLKSYFTIGWRNLLKNRGYAFINVAGLSLGMGVVLLIGLWIYDELSYDQRESNYDRIVRVMVNHTFNGEVSTQFAQPFPLGKELRDKYADDFEFVSMTSWSYGHFLEWENKKLSAEGMFVEPSFLSMVDVVVEQGSLRALDDPHSIVLNKSLAKAIFGETDPVGKTIRIDNGSVVTVTGTFSDFPDNSSFSGSRYLLPWSLYAEASWVKQTENNWGNFSFQTLAQLRPNTSLAVVQDKVKGVIVRNNPHTESNPQLILHPMSKWHLYAKFENGVNVGGDIEFVWLFGTIGAFVLALACINFMNLSTARSEKRAKEVGLRKVIGSMRRQLIVQFLSESMFISAVAVIFSLVIVQFSLGWFNDLTAKQIALPIGNVWFWMGLVCFVAFTGALAGSYPAVYLSSFRPANVLKGVFMGGRSAAFPRRILIVVQFTVSITLIIGTIIVHRQVMYAKDRPLGYDRSNLVTTYGYPFNDHSSNPVRYEYLKNELLQTGGVVKMGKTSSPTTDVYSNQSDFEWEGKDPNVMPNFAVVWCSHDYGDAIGLQYLQGRGFSRQIAGDTAAILLNESAVAFMGLEDPVGKIIRFNRSIDLQVIGVVQNVLMESPYREVRPTVYMVHYNGAQILTMKLNPALSASEALARIEPVFKKFNPESLFETQFVEAEHDKKFRNEERVGRLANVFAGLAIFISCVGIFAMASFTAERRTKEIGIRKILGAPVFTLWKLLSRDFVGLVTIACVIAVPVSYILLTNWLEHFTYHTALSVWIFLWVVLGSLFITLMTVSFQSVKAATMNPVKSLRSE